MSSSPSVTKGPKKAQDDASLSMLEAHIYSQPSAIERILFEPNTSCNAGKRNLEMQEDVEKLGDVIAKDLGKKAKGVKL
ncbi:hypothetical protein DL98DRAFT_514330 [Cadophora sp. DSE1049]|nr:hypothetical protein DL98DRAFT_514330 [Cadophora sp. DSE1049]